MLSSSAFAYTSKQVTDYYDVIKEPMGSLSLHSRALAFLLTMVRRSRHDGPQARIKYLHDASGVH